MDFPVGYYNLIIIESQSSHSPAIFIDLDDYMQHSVVTIFHTVRFSGRRHRKQHYMVDNRD